ncbi:MAG: hypothetical protein EBU92_14340 [Betaproteobacteria bacterium]|nr:hypothetical protein [Betaproteobacteria bacterium]
MILFMIALMAGYAACCTFSSGGEIQHGYCVYTTGQYGNGYYAINTGCYMDCKCRINSTTGVSYSPVRACLVPLLQRRRNAA